MDVSLSLDPLIAEAKLRMRRRRIALALFVVIAATAVLAYALRPSGTPNSGRTVQRSQSGQALARLTVPLDATERMWRTEVESLRGSPVPHSRVVALRRRVLAAARATGATLVRIRIWPTTSPPAVELVLATNIAPAVYLRHSRVRLMNLLKRPQFVKVVDGHGSLIFEWGGAANEGFLGPPPALYYCGPIGHDVAPPGSPCPVE